MKESTAPLPEIVRKNNALQEYFSRRFRILLTGDPDGIPPWLGVVAAGEGPGLYLPTDAPWVAHADLATLVGGVRALLMQALHPGSLAGVRSHSRYKDDPLGRLSGTIRWLTITTYGSHEAIANEANRVNRMHDRVKGEYQNAQGESTRYRAELKVTDETRETIQWIKNPPLPVTSKPMYALLFQSALASLGSEYQEMIGLNSLPLGVLRPLTTRVLQFMRFSIGPESPIEEAAIRRIQRSRPE